MLSNFQLSSDNAFLSSQLATTKQTQDLLCTEILELKEQYAQVCVSFYMGWKSIELGGLPYMHTKSQIHCNYYTFFAFAKVILSNLVI